MHRRFGVLLALAGLAAAARPARAQFGGRQFVGVAAGATMSSTQGSVANDTRWGGTFAMVLGYRASNWTALTIEPAWAQKGNSTAIGDLQFAYFQIPATTGFVKRLGEQWRLSGYTGIGVGIKLQCTSPDPAFDCADASGSEWYIPVGLRVARMLGNNSLGVDVRYEIPISDAFRSQDVRNQSVQFRLFYLWGDLQKRY